MKIFCGVEHAAGSTTRYRVNLPAEVLRKRLGWTIDVSDQIRMPAAEDWDYDLVILQRNSTMDMLRLLRSLEALAVPVGYDIDDDILNLETTNPVYDLYMKYPNIPWYQLQGLRFARGVTVSTPRLAEVYRAVNENVRVLPNCVSLADWNSPDLAPLAWAPGEVVAVWAGSNTHLGSLALVASTLGEVARAYPQFRVVIMGEQDLPLEIPARQVTWLGWSAYATYQAVLKSAHIGLAPLQGTRFNLAKSDLRIKEYAAAGLAILASPTGEYKESAQLAGGLLCDDAEEWQAALVRLIEHPRECRDRGIQARAWVENWDIECHADAWAEAWRELVGQPLYG